MHAQLWPRTITHCTSSFQYTHIFHASKDLSHFVFHIKFQHHSMLLAEVVRHEDDGICGDASPQYTPLLVKWACWWKQIRGWGNDVSACSLSLHIGTGTGLTNGTTQSPSPCNAYVVAMLLDPHQPSINWRVHHSQYSLNHGFHWSMHEPTSTVTSAAIVGFIPWFIQDTNMNSSLTYLLI